MRHFTVVILFSLLVGPLSATDPVRDFAGKWVLDVRGSNSRALPMKPDASLTVAQQDIALRCSAQGVDGTVQWTYLLDGTETRSRQGGDSWSSVAKWEGAALLVNTQVSGAHEYTIMDRWSLSRDHATLIISRQVVSRGGTVEGELLYTRGQDRRGQASETTPAANPASPPADASAAIPPDPQVQPQPVQRRDDAPPPGDFVVPKGTRIALTLNNNLDTKKAHAGDHVYLQVSVPVFANGHQVIPKGSYVNGVVTEAKPASGMKGKGQLFIHFETLTLPNGVQRDFHSRLGSADSGRGTVDQEGGVTGQRDTTNDARDVAIGTGVGAGIGGIAGSAAGHPLGGVGVGAAAGAAVGLATILHDKKADVVLPRGTMLEMVLDRDLIYTKEELQRY